MNAMLLLLLLLPGLVSAGTTVKSEWFGGNLRSYAITVPDGCESQGTVFVLHGKNGSHRILWRNGLNVQAQDYCRVVVAPDSLRISWNKALDGPDVAYLEHLIAQHPGPLAFIGHSAGATMSQVMHWCLGYGSKVVLSANSTTDEVQALCAPFDGGRALLVMGKLDKFWAADDRPAFLDFVDDVAEASECGRSWQSRETGEEGDTVYRRYARCNVGVVVPLWMDHDWWPPLAEYAFSWMFD